MQPSKLAASVPHHAIPHPASVRGSTPALHPTRALSVQPVRLWDMRNPVSGLSVHRACTVVSDDNSVDLVRRHGVTTRYCNLAQNPTRCGRVLTQNVGAGSTGNEWCTLAKKRPLDDTTGRSYALIIQSE
jgi:hypothetical protein